MIKIIFCLILFFISCKNNENVNKISDVQKDINIKETNSSLSEDHNIIIGEWLHNDDLHIQLSKKYMKEDIQEIKNDFSLSKEEQADAIKKYIPKGKLSGNNAFGEIKMIFNKDFTYNSYFDNKFYYGKWKIKNKSLFMKREDAGNKWIGYQYDFYEDNLIILDGQWLMTFTKKKEN